MIVKQSGGSISVDSQLGSGTTFRIYLPSVLDRPPALVVPTESPSLRGSETILVAEDQEEVQHVVRASLTRYGYTVLDASSGEAALAIALRCDQPIHLLMTDVVMPFMSGPELVAQLRISCPDIRVLFTSGYTDDAMVRHGMLQVGVAFIQKPFTPQSLARKVRDVLDAPRDDL